MLKICNYIPKKVEEIQLNPLGLNQGEMLDQNGNLINYNK